MKVAICDVAPRDGLQNDPVTVAPEVRAELVGRIVGAGVPRVEIASFVNPKRVPQMAGAEEVVAATDMQEGVVYSGLVLNEKGYDRLAPTALREVHYSFGATESFNTRNSNATVADGLATATRIVQRAHDDDRRVSVAMAVVFGCPFEGPVDETHILRLAEQLAGAGVDEIVLGDTIGVATPGQAKRLVNGAACLGVDVVAHFHNTRNTGLACAWAALEAGASGLDGSVGGVGGCPFAPRATGNIPTEDLVYLLHREGVETGIDLEALIDVANWLEGILGRELPGMLYRAGLFPPVAA